MALTLDAEVSGTSSNSYLTVAEADAYFETQLYTDTWDSNGDEDKAKALIMATRLLDQWFDWYGGITNLHQALLWPRMGVLRPGITTGAVGTGAVNDWAQPFATLLDAHTIPPAIKNATAELGQALLKSNRTADSDIETQGIQSLTAGPVSLAFRSGVIAKTIPDAVMSMVTAYGSPKSRYGTGYGAISMYRG